MSSASAPDEALASAAELLTRLGRRFAVVGGLAVSVRGEVRFTRDVDLAVLVEDDRDAEQLVFQLRDAGYAPIATVEHTRTGRLATARLASPTGIVVDLLFASSGIEPEIVDRATPIELALAGALPVAAAEELVAMKVLSMSESRLQDRLDAQRLLQHAEVDLDRVRLNLRLIAERRCDRDQDLEAKLELVLRAVRGA
jgi:hypothetical protein